MHYPTDFLFAVQNMDVDWDLLHQQKTELVSMIWDKPDSNCWGLVEFIDNLQDAAVDCGKWDFPEKDTEPKFPLADLPGPQKPEEGSLLWNMDQQKPYRFEGSEWREIDVEEYVQLLDALARRYHKDP